MTSVKGGTLASAVTMRAKLNKDGLMDIDTYQTWARSIADAPALLYSEVGSKSKDFFRGFFFAGQKNPSCLAPLVSNCRTGLLMSLCVPFLLRPAAARRYARSLARGRRQRKDRQHQAGHGGLRGRVQRVQV